MTHYGTIGTQIVRVVERSQPFGAPQDPKRPINERFFTLYPVNGDRPLPCMRAGEFHSYSAEDSRKIHDMLNESIDLEQLAVEAVQGNASCADFMARCPGREKQARMAYIEAIRPLSRLAALRLSLGDFDTPLTEESKSPEC